MVRSEIGRCLGINISVARPCFVRCDGCYNHFGKSKETPTEKILAFLDYAWKRGMRKVTMCGGDPLARLDIIDLLKEVKSLGYKINLDTVGTPLLGGTSTNFFDQRSVEAIDPMQLANLVDLLGIPVDGASNTMVSKFRTGRTNLLDEQIEILRILDENKAHTCVNTVVHKLNISDVETILDLISVFPSVIRWQMFQFTPTGPLGYRNREKFAIDTDTFSTIITSIQDLASSKGFRGMIEAKSNVDRKYRYMLIDSDGFAWMPRSSQSQTWSDEVDTNDQRVILGNITQSADYESILSAVFNLVQ